jgi:Cys-rich protein (TIGR01571 family)
MNLVLCTLALYTTLGRSAMTAASQSAKYLQSRTKMREQMDAAEDDGIDQRDALVQYGQNELAQHQALVRRVERSETMELQTRLALLHNQQVLLKLQQEEEAEERRLMSFQFREDSLRSQASIARQQPSHANTLATLGADSENAQSEVDGDSGMIHYKQSTDEFWGESNKLFRDMMICIGVYMAQVLFWAVLWKEFLKPAKQNEVKTGGEQQSDLFEYSLFDTSECCGRDRMICCCAWCCIWIRWADTASDPRLDFLEFYPAVFIVSLLSIVSLITFGASIPLVLLIVVIFRTKLRKAYNLEDGTWRTMCHDCCVWLCCSPCVAAQEARQVAYVKPVFVGEPVVVSPGGRT